MTRNLRNLIVLFGLCFLVPEAMALPKCIELLARTFQSEARPYKMTVLYYPTYPDGESFVERMTNFSHMKVAVNDVVYDTVFEFSELGKKNALERLARIQYTKGYIEFSVQLSAREKDRAQEILNTRSDAGVFCHDGACRVLRQAAGFRVPSIFQILPSHVGIYLAINHLIGGRVSDLRYVGKNGIVSLLSTNLVVEAALTAGAVAPGVWLWHDLVSLPIKLITVL